jgi:hypothetical protein
MQRTIGINMLRKLILLIAALFLIRGASASCTVPTFTTAPTISSITQTGATVSWATNTITNGQVFFGQPEPGTPGGVFDTSGQMSHTYTITGMVPGSQTGWGVISEAIDTSLGTPCGAGYYLFSNGPGGITFNTLGASGGVFTYGVYAGVNPSYNTQTYPTYFHFILETLTGTYPTNSLKVTVAGLPSPCNCQIFWPNSEATAPYGLGNLDADTISTTTVPGDTDKMYEFIAKEFVFLSNVGGTTAPGSYTMTVTASAVTTTAWNSGTAYVVGNEVSSSGVNYYCILANTNQAPPNSTYWNVVPTVSITLPLVVVAQSTPFNGTAMTFSTPTLTGVGYPAIPQLSTYLATANTYGIENCSQDTTSPGAIRPNNQATLTPVGFSTTYGAWFYGDNLYANIRSLLNNGTNWEQCITNIKQVYRNNYALVGTIQTLMTLSTGYYGDYLTAAEPADIALINEFNSTDYYSPVHGGMVDVGYLQRETAYMLRNLTHGLALGQTAGGILSMSAVNVREYTKEHVLGHLDEICLTQSAQYWENFMIGLEADGLIQYYNLVSQDPRIPVALKCVADYLWTNQWQALNTGDFPYDKYQWLANASNANVTGGNCNVVLDQYFAFLYAWLFTITGSSTYQTEGDTIFSYGVQMGQAGSGSCGGGIGPNFAWPSGFNSGKQFAQQYHLGYNYVIWRTQPPVSTVPASGVSF